MNYYEHHLGDYAAATSHLSWDEDMAYTRLLRAYYHHERAIQEGQQYRLARAATPAQRKAVDTVLREFFELRDGHWHQARADREVERFRDKQEKAKRSANARWSGVKSQSDGNANAYANAHANAHANALPTHSEGNAPKHQTLEDISDEAKASSSSAEPTRRPRTPTIPCPYDAIVEAYHAELPELPRCRLLPAKRQAAMRKVWGWVLRSQKPDGSRRATNADEALEWLRAYFRRASENDWLMGRTPRSADHATWRCDLDYLLTDGGMKRVIEHTEHRAA